MPLLVVSVVPQANGMVTFYRNLRTGLAPFGWEVRGVTVGTQEHMTVDAQFGDDGWVSLVPDETDFERQRQAFVNWCIQEQVAALIPMISEVCLQSIPRLPAEIQIIMRCTYTSERGYKMVTRYPDRTAYIVALAPRQRIDLVEHYGVDPSKIVLIQHGVDLSRFPISKEKATALDRPIEIAYLGRINQNEKGVLDIPLILSHLDKMGLAFHLKIAGTGADITTLQQQLAPFIHGNSVSMMGELLPTEIPSFLARSDIFLFTSREEGFSNALMEAMAAGCVPVASRLKGITDFIITDERMGLLCDAGDSQQFALAIMTLANDRERLFRMSKFVRQQIADSFSMASMAQQYSTMLNRLTQGNSITQVTTAAIVEE